MQADFEMEVNAVLAHACLAACAACAVVSLRINERTRFLRAYTSEVQPHSSLAHVFQILPHHDPVENLQPFKSTNLLP